MGAPKTWQSVVVPAPLKEMPHLLPDRVEADGAFIEPRHETTAEGAFWGRDARRFRAVWGAGRWSGPAYIEFRPHSSDTSEAVVHLEAPRGLPGRLRWTRARLYRTAVSLTTALRERIRELSARRRTGRSPVREAGSA